MPELAATAERSALLLHIQGVVQGVGFRPHVARLASRHRLAGWVRNESGEVRVRIEGDPPDVQAFVQELPTDLPPLARIDSLHSASVAPENLDRFEIVASETRPDRRLPISPDVALCRGCEAELSEASNRRYRYPFITCTDCGPRFTVIETMPYDRERTSMRDFQQCPECLREYRDPADRRCHSQTNSCPTCGPRVWLEVSGRPVAQNDASIRAAAHLLREGEIVAIRGLGGFHLAADATSDPAVRRLRGRKARDEKPLAVMVRDLEAARRLGAVGELEERLLTSPERPIVVLRRAWPSELAPSVSPGLDTVGVMTAYTPLHALLLEEVERPLVMTSGNASEEPIAIGNAEARELLGGIADAFLLHDREIISRYDDSVVRVAGASRVFLRRARGYAPLPLELPLETPAPLIAVGPHLKNTFALAHEHRAYVSQHIGDLENLETLDHFQHALARFRELFSIEPSVAVRDLHPGYLSTRVAEELGLETVIAVQHHHAHIAAVAAEHGVTDRVLGIAFDGVGLGHDDRVWGAEFLLADLEDYLRVGQLRYAPLPGGDLVARRPWRAALGYLSLAPESPEAADALRFALQGIPGRRLAVAEAQIQRRLNAPLASSMGRLFDAASAVLGVRQRATYEGQAAMELEALAGSGPAEPLRFPAIQSSEGFWTLDPVPLLSALGELRAEGEDARILAACFHESVAATAARVAREACEAFDLNTVALGGGCFQNARLLVSLRRRIEASGLRVLLPIALGPNDGAISYGQAAVAAARLASGRVRLVADD
ncbi:MAG: carbamoyltransferase HypF [Gemmatimonadales bacterium]|jgi:hydrogenase maturation protein HypF